MKTQEVGFIGLGNMGAPMARRLLAEDIKVRVFDKSEDARNRFLGIKNCTVCNSVDELANDLKYVFMILPDSNAVTETLISARGIAVCMDPSGIVVDMTTGSLSAFHRNREELAKRGPRLLDIPMGRTPTDAEAGSLLVMAGGDRKDIKEVETYLMIFGRDIVYAGPPGSGLKLKLVNNYMTMVSMVLTSETLALGSRLGLDQSMLVKVLQGTVAGKGQINTNFPKKVLSGDISPDFSIRLGTKDLNMALELGSMTGVPLLLGGVAQSIFSLAQSSGLSEHDCTSLFPFIEELGLPGSADSVLRRYSN
jgi:4-hydroxybutyrate dehydrogenase / sulfolactaldehyde 3-reductase